MRRAKIWMTAALAVGMAACAHRQATDPANTARMVAVQADIAAARKAGGENDPRASMHLALARKQLEQAQRLGNDGQHAEAARVLQRAELDAELAVAIAQEGNLRRDAEETRARISQLQAQGTTVEVTP